ncbi:MAG: hypothetical protein HUJ72_03630 [Blautia sp.]|nr:hypothetical protein [Blautia sp.]
MKMQSLSNTYSVIALSSEDVEAIYELSVGVSVNSKRLYQMPTADR